ncbi:MAG: IS110 family transposase [Sphingobacteriales bacterium]|nr:MAG: IS110 family transposase [Sphingobacteriales bacterium]
MKKLLKQAIGVDVAQDELVATFGKKYDDLSYQLVSTSVFKNTKTGMIQLLKWSNKLKEPDYPIVYVMEATGIYHELFAYYLVDNLQVVNIVLPSKISHYIKTLELKTINDSTCSSAIAQFGLGRKLEEWQKPKPIFKYLRQLTRERDQIVDERTIVKNQLHADSKEAEPNEIGLKRMNARINLLNIQEAQIKIEIDILIASDDEITEAVANMSSIKGISTLTSAIILAETNGFELIRNKKQLVSYAGLDIIDKSSGTSVKAKPRISKRGNRYLRKALFFPSMTAIRHNKIHKEIHEKISEKSGIKKKGLTAVQRKLLELSYILFKTKTKYNNEYEVNKTKKKESEKNQPSLQPA